jgi:hypothetical protein
MRTRIAVALVPVYPVACVAFTTVAQVSSNDPFYITPIHAEFYQKQFDTEFETHAELATGEKTAHLQFVWSLKLELVDKAAAPDSQMPGSGATVDLGCNNDGDGEQTSEVTLTAKAFSSASEFFWRHPEAQDSVLEGLYHCDHELQGPHGHQGSITFTVSDANWKCMATFKGTHSSLSAPLDEPNPNVTNGIASEPTCSKLLALTSAD